MSLENFALFFVSILSVFYIAITVIFWSFVYAFGLSLYALLRKVVGSPLRSQNLKVLFTVGFWSVLIAIVGSFFLALAIPGVVGDVFEYIAGLGMLVIGKLPFGLVDGVLRELPEQWMSNWPELLL